MGLKSQIRKLFRPAGSERAGTGTVLSTSASLGDESPELAATLASKFPDIPESSRQTYLAVKSLTMTSPERIFGLCQAVDHVLKAEVPGDFVECGVWRGGSSVAMIRSLLNHDVRSRDLWLYDTFEGMSSPTDHDVDCFGNPAANLLDRDREDRVAPTSVWCEASLEDVQSNVGRCGYPRDKMHFVQGKVEDTIPQQIPDQIALLRLDTDWFESTWHELTHLYPRLVPGGILIIDDYGHWQGCRQAVDQYLAAHAPDLFLHRLDYTGRLAVKPHPSQGRLA
ncbi:MAG: TylF/MycF/NovP-related O-methyltransferase [Pirellulaceae bacterium]|nr:TylF/MycF/NovP-related O-methyltransferase [Pirellulaceae bacterium]